MNTLFKPKGLSSKLKRILYTKAISLKRKKMEKMIFKNKPSFA